jgi:proteic killer suppression protein
MIKTFKDEETHKIWSGIKSRKLPPDIQDVVRRKLRMLNNAQIITDLLIPPSNKLESLKGDRKGQHSIRINDKYRICFEWKSNDAFNVEIVDYH